MNIKLNYNEEERLVENKKEEMRKKADHNKFETLICFKVIMLCTLLIPIFISFGSGSLYGKLLPSFLSLLAGAITAWVQLRKPQELWKIYRTAQRRMETELEKYQFEIGDYESEEKHKNKLLVEKVIEISEETHEKWSKHLPSPGELKNTVSAKN
ncbi:DUF4231 domain-containing protein [Pseudoalteromonas rubra]|uniref:DUF4231 domain-containing protein n=1 Tax=Pseudoalteromonas rubra TaxID=43658 RepID=A0A4Q7EL69_9GAMM|nr:DUF4231 domain-containing protein [Pseudoalteromonas rubra]RZM84386.1 DUF4231 domain-containing protein [Pseudoalteromonas rubra]